jgi:hypothetical protein
MTGMQCGRVAARRGHAVRAGDAVRVSGPAPVSGAGKVSGAGRDARNEPDMAGCKRVMARPVIDVAVETRAAAGAPR